MKAFFKLVSLTVGVVPGLAIIITNIGVSPIFSSKLMGGLVEATSSFIIAYVLVNRRQLIKKDTIIYNYLSVITIVLFVICFCTYSKLYDNTYIMPGQHQSGALNPYWVSDDCTRFIKSIGLSNLQDYFDEKGPLETKELLIQQSAFSYYFTIESIYLLFILMFSSLTTSFVALWIRKETLQVHKRKNPKPKLVDSPQGE